MQRKCHTVLYLGSCILFERKRGSCRQSRRIKKNGRGEKKGEKNEQNPGQRVGGKYGGGRGRTTQQAKRDRDKRESEKLRERENSAFSLARCKGRAAFILTLAPGQGSNRVNGATDGDSFPRVPGLAFTLNYDVPGEGEEQREENGVGRFRICAEFGRSDKKRKKQE